LQLAWQDELQQFFFGNVSGANWAARHCVSFGKYTDLPSFVSIGQLLRDL
jgi:hypothetical protein